VLRKGRSGDGLDGRRRHGDGGRGGHNNLTTCGRGGSFELSYLWAAPPRDCCWDFVFS
jgi:hypothetical protein